MNLKVNFEDTFQELKRLIEIRKGMWEKFPPVSQLDLYEQSLDMVDKDIDKVVVKLEKLGKHIEENKDSTDNGHTKEELDYEIYEIALDRMKVIHTMRMLIEEEYSAVVDVDKLCIAHQILNEAEANVFGFVNDEKKTMEDDLEDE